ncbi:Type I phosphodiesterase / nucleotide pyrophosphatase [Nocardioides dokdonensis FR1436]|uniref:Type I phosphodiesterase / nucleotide pyrophosphatase n=1 Tax=Nocardioides dokdonensis FR1436 TaxID=1300347 RepID=A0A1A9GET6_9ACTN|nr:alkaline phosphatase family protein [Nocardioides dokdonensis]ANH36576.1 Type I phosphodiesterase / nucleotide pyrophosphatase [Nocardioides dokdonensis FR1436]
MRLHRIAPPRSGRRLTTALLSSALLLGAASTLPSTAEAPPARSAAQPAGPLTFQVSSFNLLGAGHTDGAKPRRGFDKSEVRLRRAIEILDRESIDVVGFQEMHQAQFQKFTEWESARFGLYPGSQLGAAPMHNSIAWRTAQWQALRTESIKIPYFKGNEIRMPYVLLQHVETGQQAWFLNVHNPADARGPAQKWRDEAVRRESALVNRLRAQSPGVPVFFTGDMNDREEFFCPAVGRTELQAANGGGADGDVCEPPPGMRVDWLLGTAPTVFTGYAALSDALVKKTTDHPVIVADAVIPNATVQASPIDRVVVLAVEGLRSSSLDLGSGAFGRLAQEGASTLNARTTLESTSPLPNAVSMLTGRRVDAAALGHGVAYNNDRGETVRTTAGRYVSSIFDVVHNQGGRTYLAANRNRFDMVDRSWDATNGGRDPYGFDDGADKIDKYFRGGNDYRLVEDLRARLERRPATFTYAELSSLDKVGRKQGFASERYAKALRRVERMVGRTLDSISGSRKLAGRTLLVVAGTNGGVDGAARDDDRTGNYTVPLMVWGPGVVPGADLYDLNPEWSDPGNQQAGYESPAPIHTGIVANLTLSVLGLPPLPGSLMNNTQRFAVLGGPQG